MAITIDWATKVISIPKADLLLIQSSPTEILQLDINAFWRELKDIEDDEGMPYLDTQSRNAPTSVGGVTLAPVVQIINGYTVTFEDGQYAVNLIGANSNIGDVVNVNQVSVRSANSAGLTFSEEINAQSYLGAAVYIDVANGLSGQSFPRGTPTDPVNNYTDAKAIADFRKFTDFVLTGALSFSPSDSATETFWQGKSPILASVVFDGNDITGASFENLACSGLMNGFVALRDCRVSGVTGFWGTMRECLLQGGIVFDASAPGPFVFGDCASGVPGTDRPTVDMNGVAADFQLRGYEGGITLEGLTQDQNVSLDVNSGTVEIGTTCTDGTVVVRGLGKLIDNSGPGCSVISTGFFDPTQDIEAGLTSADMQRLILAAVAGKGGDDGNGTYRYRDIADTKDRIVAPTDGQGNRTTIALDGE